jgi:DnaK suppressor protein
MSDLAAELRPRLEERLTTLTRREEALQRHLRGQDGRLEADSSDKVGFNGQDEVLEGLEESALREIPQIQAALSRIDRGTFGACVKCGSDIAQGRLRALPFTPLCVGCAGKTSEAAS